MRSSTVPARVSQIPVAIAVALRQPVRRALAIAGAGQALHLELHQPLGGKADHLAQEIGVGTLLQKLAQGDAVVGHRGGLRSGLLLATQPYRRSRGDRPYTTTWDVTRTPRTIEDDGGGSASRAY